MQTKARLRNASASDHAGQRTIFDCLCPLFSNRPPEKSRNFGIQTGMENIKGNLRRIKKEKFQYGQETILFTTISLFSTFT